MTRTVLLCYRRRSVVKDAVHLVSPQRQKDAVTALAAANGYEPEWYADLDTHNSARTGERAGWQNLVAQLDRPDVVGIAAWDLSRIYRNVKEFLALVDELDRRGLILITVKENINTASATGRAIVTILMTIYQLESDLASERMTENIRYKRRKLGRHWGRPPFGTQRNGDKILEPDPETIGDLRACYELYATGEYSYDRLAVELNHQGHRYRDRSGDPRPWGREDVRRCVYGWQLYRGDLPLGSLKDRPEDVVDGAHDPILDVALCEKVGATLKKRTNTYARTGSGGDNRRFYLLGGIAQCGECGQPLHGSYQGRVRRYRHTAAKDGCAQPWVDAEMAEEQLHRLFREIVESPALLESIEGEIAKLRRLDESDEVRHLYAEIEETKDQLTRLTDFALEDLIPKVEYVRRRAELEDRLDHLRAQIPQTTADELENAVERALDVLAEFPDLESTEQKELLRALLEAIEIEDGHITRLIPRPWAAPLFEKQNSRGI